MGVEKFFSSLKKDFTKEKQFIYRTSKKINCNHFFIDFNSIVHHISQNMLRQDKVWASSDLFEEELINRVGEYITVLLKEYLIAQDIESIYICVDGVPTMSKIFEQKKRRYMGDFISHLTKNDNMSKFHWSKNNISPGTDFMQNMIKKLNSKDYYDEIKILCSNLSIYNVSGIDIPGEGEFKIIEIIDKADIKKSDILVVYSPDSDMILLLLLNDFNVKMLRFDQQYSTENNMMYDIIEINKFKNILVDYTINIFDPIESNVPLHQNRIIADLVFILTIFGDDFLPKLETVRVNLDIQIILDLYAINLSNGYLLDIIKREHRNIYSIDKNNFLKYLNSLQKQ